VQLAESDGFIPERLNRIDVDVEGFGVAAVVAGERSVPRSAIRDLALERIEMNRAGGSWRARVVLLEAS